MKQIIITFSGKAQHGKDSSAQILKQILQDEYGKRILTINYADYLKYLAAQYLNWNGEKDERGRTLLQWLGTEKVRTRFPDLWVDTVINIAQIFEGEYDCILIGDCRFPNEITRWVDEGYTVIPIHVERLEFDNGLTDAQKNHHSETALDDYPFRVKLKAYTLHDLEREIRLKCKGLIAP